MSQKIENQLNLALDITEEERQKSESLDIGYDPEEKEWELIVKYSETLERVRTRAVYVTELTGGYAIIQIKESQIKELAAFPEVEFIEKPKSLYFQVENGRRVSCIEGLYMDSLCSHHAEIQYLYLIHNVYNVIILPFHSCKKKREPFTALFHIDFLIHLSYSTVCQPMSLNFFPKMGQSLVLHQMPPQLLSFDHILLQIPMQIHSSKHLSK